jgi:ParB family chromosome partitioning protein
MKLLELPEDVIQLLVESEIPVTVGEELLSIKEKDQQSKVAKIVLKHSIDSKSLRNMIKEEKYQFEEQSTSSFYNSSTENEKFLKAFDKTIICLKIAMNKLSMNIEKIEENWVLYEILMNHKNAIHSQIDVLIREKKKYRDHNHYFDLILARDLDQ